MFKNIACSLKLLFSIYILFNFNIAQAPSNEIWVRYNNDQFITFKRTWLEDGGVSTVAKLIGAIKFQLDDEELSDKVFTLHRGEEVLDSKTLISGLYNGKNESLEVVVEGKIELEHLLLCLIFVFKLNMV